MASAIPYGSPAQAATRSAEAWVCSRLRDLRRICPARHGRDQPVGRAGADEHGADFLWSTAGLGQRRPDRGKGQVLRLPAGVAALVDPGFRADLGGGHRRPREARVPDHVVVAADVLAAHDREGLELRADPERLPHLNWRIRRHRGYGLGPLVLAFCGGRLAPVVCRALDPVDEGQDVTVARMERDHEVVVTDLVRPAQVGARAIPRVLVVQDHRPAHQRLEFGHVLAGVEDLLGREHRIVGVMVRHHERQRPGLSCELRHGRLYRGQFRGVMQLGAEHAEQQVEHPVLGVGVPGRGQLAEGMLDRGHLPLAVRPRGQHRKEDVVAALRQVTPSGRPLVEHGDRVPVDPEQVLAQVTQ